MTEEENTAFEEHERRVLARLRLGWTPEFVDYVASGVEACFEDAQPRMKSYPSRWTKREPAPVEVAQLSGVRVIAWDEERKRWIWVPKRYQPSVDFLYRTEGQVYEPNPNWSRKDGTHGYDKNGEAPYRPTQTWTIVEIYKRFADNTFDGTPDGFISDQVAKEMGLNA